MLFVVDGNSGAVVYRTTLSTTGPVMHPWPPEETVARAAAETGLDPADLLTWTPPNAETARALVVLPLDSLVAILEGGQVVEVGPAPADPELWLHLSITGGDGDTPPGVLNDGVDALAVAAALRVGPGGSDPVVPVDEAWRITVRTDTGAVYDVVRVGLVEGLANVSYTTSGATAVCQVLESDFLPLAVAGSTYRVRLAAPVVFKIYREL